MTRHPDDPVTHDLPLDAEYDGPPLLMTSGERGRFGQPRTECPWCHALVENPCPDTAAAAFCNTADAWATDYLRSARRLALSATF